MTELDPKDSVRNEQFGNTENTNSSANSEDTNDSPNDGKEKNDLAAEEEGNIPITSPAESEDSVPEASNEPGKDVSKIAPNEEQSDQVTTSHQEVSATEAEETSESAENIEPTLVSSDEEKEQIDELKPEEVAPDAMATPPKEEEQEVTEKDPVTVKVVTEEGKDPVPDDKENVETASVPDSANSKEKDAETTPIQEKDDAGTDIGEGINQPEIETTSENSEGTELTSASTNEKEANTDSKTVSEETPDLETPTAEENKPVKDVSGSDKDKSNTDAEKEVIKEQKDQPRLPGLSEVDYTEFTKEKLVDTFSQYLSDFHVDQLKGHIEAIKSVFYKKLNEETENIKSKFLSEGGVIEDFKVEETPIELRLKDLLNVFRDKRSEHTKSLESQKETNLQTKLEIIEAIKDLINSQESLNKTFHDFRNLQERWREVGAVPQKNVKDLWESYHYHVEAFYDFIKINKELRDLDFKKNLNSKIALCEKAEELLIEPSVVEAFRNLQLLHDQWREIGPVPSDKRSEIWERFRDTTSKINHRHQEYFVNLKEEQKNNLQEKTILCEKAEEIVQTSIGSAKEWEVKSKEIIELQKIWKTIGFAPKKNNAKIYERFRAACDTFFDSKREYFAQNREEQENNLQLKTELCIQAEGLQDDTDWKKTTDELIRLQKKWKTIGPVPIKQSDKIWKRFRAACDTFFNNKSKFFENIDTKYEDNLKLKEELLVEIENYKLDDNVEENLKQLKDFQRKWSGIGFVPIKQKDSIQERYREIINAKFDQLKIDEDKKSVLKFRSRVEGIASKPNADRRLTVERDKCFNKIKQLENDITLWENNIGFFSNSKNAESLRTDVEQKIASAKRRIEALKEKLDILDNMD